MRIAVIVLCALLPHLASAQSFSCRIGTRAACLDYGDTICSSLGKCVDQDAQCFNRYQCDYAGFTCQSNVTDCLQEYETLLRTHNTLVDDYNGLLADIRAATRMVSNQEDELRDIERCLAGASSLELARLCAP
ncbi:hypothetical protein [Octadecabacter sp. R77987]|uniref:hypothetical protein n=1 Tax=Octadecabacter sp. R77987 TaxID=3093874 RepID=UPI00366D6DC8